MSQNKELTFKRLSELWNSKEIPVLDTFGVKYVIFSDAHLGDGSDADDFQENQETLETALDFYKKNDYKLILLGDIEELWQFDLNRVVTRYGENIYQKIREFEDINVYRIFGNHDIDWRTLPDPTKNAKPKLLFATEALKINDSNKDIRILALHGHQGSTESELYIWSSRYWVRLYKFVEPVLKWFGIVRPPEAPKSRILDDYEKIFYSWARENKVIVICGHSHRAIFASKSFAERLTEKIEKLKKRISENRDDMQLVKELKKEIRELNEEKREERRKKRAVKSIDPEVGVLPCYFNTGCCIYGSGITSIEIADGKIRLVKWERDRQREPRFMVYEEGSLSSYIVEVMR